MVHVLPGQRITVGEVGITWNLVVHSRSRSTRATGTNLKVLLVAGATIEHSISLYASKVYGIHVVEVEQEF